ncbi:uncharacterized protein EKO05_0001271 [Ascochyta rabiei]|uniref:uncharacterized protein n=1 Tax=Didymella rabiei TaxID=5454 RepID=UPI001902A4A8|nr:uncharacterized protein EKO05_0001271 [Ascochyta rabiei]UPX10625.1 hypothetical protein EKO05_0001271 [Ascochyta rabiei]
MLVASFVAALLSAVEVTYSAPIEGSSPPSDPYNCGYVRTRWNSSAVAGIFALESCTLFYYNETIGNYQDAFAYTLYGGCTCRFYSIVEDCLKNAPVPQYTGSTDRWHEPLFAEPRPTWYTCHESK